MNLGCTLSAELLALYPVSMYGVWASSTEPEAEPTPDYIPNTVDGWNTEFERSAQTQLVVTEPQQSKTHEINPYSDELRYAGGLERVLNKQYDVLLERVIFYAFDGIKVGSTLVDADGQPFQDAATINAIKASAATNTKVYAQSGFNNGMIGQWQPNGFKPKMEINEKSWLGAGDPGVGGLNNIADQMLGLPLPHCETFHYQFLNEQVKSIRIWAKCTQYIGDNDGTNETPPTGVLQRYPVVAAVFFRMKR